jgi:hypothetical protein
MIINFQRPRLNPVSTKNFILEAGASDYLPDELDWDISCDITTLAENFDPMSTANRVLARVNVTLQISGNFLSISTNKYVFPQAPAPYWLGVIPGTFEALKDNKLELNEFFYRAGDPQEP